MGLDILDVTFRIEKEFEIRFETEELHKFFLEHSEPYKNFWGTGSDLRVGKLYEWVELQIRYRYSRVPDDAWPRFQHCIVDSLGVDLDEVHREAWLVRDLDMN